jgi:hypothetical protein
MNLTASVLGFGVWFLVPKGPQRAQAAAARSSWRTLKSEGKIAICHASFQAPAVLSLAVAMVAPPLQAETSVIATVGLRVLQAAGFLAATRAAITLAAITVAAEREHRATGREVTNAWAESRGTSGRHRFREAAVDNRRRSWQDDSR